MNVPARPAAEPTLVRIDWTDHLPIVGAALAFLFIMVEAYGVGDFDIPTALALYDSAGATEILLGTLLGFLPYLLPIAAFAGVWSAVRMTRRSAGWSARAAAWALAAVAGALSAWGFALVMGALLAVYGAIVVVLVRAADRRHVRMHGSRSDYRRPRERSAAGPAAVVALASFFVVSLTTPWVPPELVRVKPAAGVDFRPADAFTRVGSDLQGTAYVMGDAQGWLTLLSYRNRRVVRIPADALVSRHVCRRSVPIPRESLVQLLFARSQDSQTPPCPNS
ncbi:MAG: hypothetical protein ACJ76Z_07535 [Thermoleophilaceae bacterium]